MSIFVFGIKTIPIALFAFIYILGVEAVSVAAQRDNLNEEGEEDIEHLTPYVLQYGNENHFRSEIASRKVPHFVMFYAPWSDL